LNPTAKQNDLPVTVYESITNASSGHLNLKPVSYTMETEEAERIAIQHVSQFSSEKEKNSKCLFILLMVVVNHMNSSFNALQMLFKRIKFLVDFIQDHQDGKVVADFDLLRDIASLCSRIPAIDGDDFYDEFEKVPFK
jgi:COP9 signalosome complex subunit 6